MPETKRHCMDCVDHPKVRVHAGTPPEPNASINACDDERCIDETQRWVEQATGQTATIAAYSG